jgi:hypothetical protein
MEKCQFKAIIAEFSSRFQDLGGLAEELRQVLFPIQEGTLFTGTDMSLEGTNKLYDGPTVIDGMVNAFDAAIESRTRRSPL